MSRFLVIVGTAVLAFGQGCGTSGRGGGGRGGGGGGGGGGGAGAGGADAGGGDQGGGDQGGDAGAGAGGDAGGGADMEVVQVLQWSRGALADDPVVAIESDGGVVYALTAGKIHKFEDGQWSVSEHPELAQPIGLDAERGEASAVGLNAGGTPFLLQEVQGTWTVFEIDGFICPDSSPGCDLEPGGVDVGADRVTRVSGRYQYVTQSPQGFTADRFAGAEENRFNDIEFYDDGSGWIFGQPIGLTRSADGQYLQGFNSDVADSADANVAFLQSDTNLVRYDLAAQDQRSIPTTLTYTDTDAYSASLALFVADGGVLHAVTDLPQSAPGTGEPLMLSEIDLESSDVDFTAVHIASATEVWIGTRSGEVIRYGLGAPAGWEPVSGSDIDLDALIADPDPDPDPGPDPDPDPDPAPVEQTLMRFIGVGLGTYPCNGQQELSGVLGQRGAAAFGYQAMTPGNHTFEEDVAAAGMCRGLGIDDFDVNLNLGDAKTAILGVSISFGAPVLTDDLRAPPSGKAKVRFWGRDRIGTGDLRDIVYCVGGQAISGGSRPSGTYSEYDPGRIDVEVRVGDCAGLHRDSFNLTVAAGEVHTVVVSPGNAAGRPSREESGVYVVECTDSVDGEPSVPSPCTAKFSTPN